VQTDEKESSNCGECQYKGSIIVSNLFNLSYLIKSENRTRRQTQKMLTGVHANFPKIINTFFKLLHFIGELELPESDRGVFQSVSATHYFQAPYTFWILYDLYEKGYYLEATILYRHLVEAFIQIRYYDKYPAKIVKQLKKKNFKIMFDEFAPGYYEITYGPLLCDAAHGSRFKDFCRFERKSPTVGRTRTGCEFNAFLTTFVINQSIALLFGYLNIFGNIFPKSTIKSNSTVHKALQDVKNGLSKQWKITKKNVRKA